MPQRLIRLDLDNDQALALSMLLHRAIAECTDERVASLYDSMMPALPDPPEEASQVSILPSPIPIWAQDDPGPSGRSLVRSATSPPIMVAVLHDGSDAAFDRALRLIASLGVAIALAGFGADQAESGLPFSR